MDSVQRILTVCFYVQNHGWCMLPQNTSHWHTILNLIIHSTATGSQDSGQETVHAQKYWQLHVYTQCKTIHHNKYSQGTESNLLGKLTSMILASICLNLRVSASAFLFSKLWPFCAPFRRIFIWVRALHTKMSGFVSHCGKISGDHTSDTLHP